MIGKKTDYLLFVSNNVNNLWFKGYYDTDFKFSAYMTVNLYFVITCITFD